MVSCLVRGNGGYENRTASLGWETECQPPGELVTV